VVIKVAVVGSPMTAAVFSSSSPCRHASLPFLQWCYNGGEDGELKNNDPWQCWCVCLSLPLLQSFSVFPQFSSCSKISPLFSFLSFPCLSLKTKNRTSRPPSKKLPPIAGVESSIYRQGEQPAVAHGEQGTSGEVFNRRGFAGHAFVVF
jgi:hypothetical protein